MRPSLGAIARILDPEKDVESMGAGRSAETDQATGLIDADTCHGGAAVGCGRVSNLLSGRALEVGEISRWFEVGGCLIQGCSGCCDADGLLRLRVETRRAAWGRHRLAAPASVNDVSGLECYPGPRLFSWGPAKVIYPPSWRWRSPDRADLAWLPLGLVSWGGRRTTSGRRRDSIGREFPCPDNGYVLEGFTLTRSRLCACNCNIYNEIAAKKS